MFAWDAKYFQVRPRVVLVQTRESLQDDDQAEAVPQVVSGLPGQMCFAWWPAKVLDGQDR
jgi:hypothetical protein